MRKRSKVENKLIKVSRKQVSNKKLQQENNHLKNIINQLPGSVYWKDKQGKYLGCNDFQLKMAGMSETKEIIGKSDFELPWKDQATHLYTVDQTVMETEAPLELEEYPTLANGQQMIMLTCKAPLKDEQGDTLGIIGISIDITERKKQEVAVNTAKEQAELTLDNIVANMPGHVYWKNKEGVYLGCNNRQAKSLGLQEGSDVIGKTDFDLPWDKDIAQIFRINDIRIMESGKSEAIEEKGQMEGREVVVLSQKTPLKNKLGEVVGILGISLDISDRKQAEEALIEAKEKAEAASQAKTEFLENMRHDIRTPLTGIVGYAEIIKEETSDPKIKGHADNLVISSHALLDLLNEVLETVRIASGEIPLLRKKFDLKDKVIQIINLHQARAAEKHLDFNFSYDEKIPHYLIGDPFRVQRILLELVSNALKFTNTGFVYCSIKLARAIQNKSIIKIIIKDTGIGIPEDKQDEIFIRFRRLTPSYQGIYKGAGLGLAIVRQFIEELQGEIYVESELNKGSTFTCIIPLEEALLDEPDGVDSKNLIFPEYKKNNLSKEDINTETETISSKQIHQSYVLIVEDQEIAATIIQKYLITLNCEVDIAKDGKTACELARDNPYDLIFMDIGLPDMTGFEVTQSIRSNPSTKINSIPIVALTAHVDKESRKRCIEVGMNAVYSKPLAKNKAEDILNAFIPTRNQNHIQKDIQELKPAMNTVIDFNYAKQHLNGSEEDVHRMLKLFIKTIPEEVEALKKFYKQSDWNGIKEITHKLKGGASYLGTLRLKRICLQLEEAISENQKELFENLYNQLLVEIKLIEKAIKGKSY